MSNLSFPSAVGRLPTVSGVSEKPQNMDVWTMNSHLSRLLVSLAALVSALGSTAGQDLQNLVMNVARRADLLAVSIQRQCRIRMKSPV